MIKVVAPLNGMPDDQIWVIYPGEEIAIIGPDGEKRKSIIVKAPQVTKFVNVGK